MVEDGPLRATQMAVLDGLEPATVPVRRVRLDTNAGVAAAVQAGVEAASSPWIARMDADDIALPHRFEAQLGRDLRRVLRRRGRSDDGVRRRPSQRRRHTPDAGGARRIAAFLKRANPVNHPTVVFRRDLALEVGGYRPLAHLEDYDLWARMLVGGARFHNLPEPLLLFRSGDSMLARRRQRGVFRAEVTLQRNLHDYGLISRPRMAVNLGGPDGLQGAATPADAPRLPAALPRPGRPVVTRLPRIVRMLQPLVRVGAATAVAAVLGWLALVAVARILGAERYAEFSVLWGFYFATGRPVVRVAAGGDPDGGQPRAPHRGQPPPPPGSPVINGVALVTVPGVVLLIVSAPWWASELFGDDPWPTVVATVVGLASWRSRRRSWASPPRAGSSASSPGWSRSPPSLDCSSSSWSVRPPRARPA